MILEVLNLSLGQTGLISLSALKALQGFKMTAANWL